MVFSPKGELETIYWGKSKSAGQTKIYNKAKEAKLPDDFQITRIERMLKSNLQLKSIADLKFPFSHLTATAEMPPKPPGFDKKQWEMFSDSVKVRGHAAAIQLLSKTKRKKVVKWSAENASPLWQPEELWKEWSQTAELFLERLLWTPHKS